MINLNINKDSKYKIGYDVGKFNINLLHDIASIASIYFNEKVTPQQKDMEKELKRIINSIPQDEELQEVRRVSIKELLENGDIDKETVKETFNNGVKDKLILFILKFIYLNRSVSLWIFLSNTTFIYVNILMRGYTKGDIYIFGYTLRELSFCDIVICVTCCAAGVSCYYFEYMFTETSYITPLKGVYYVSLRLTKLSKLIKKRK